MQRRSKSTQCHRKPMISPRRQPVGGNSLIAEIAVEFSPLAASLESASPIRPISEKERNRSRRCVTRSRTPRAGFEVPARGAGWSIGSKSDILHLQNGRSLCAGLAAGVGIPREIDETAAIDGYSFPRFFIRIFIPLIANGIGVTAFFCVMFSWVEELLATTLTSANALPFAAVMTRSYSASGMDWSLLAAAGVLTMIPGAVVIWFVRNHIAKGFALGRV